MYLPPWLMITFSFFEIVYSSLETARQSDFGGEAANDENENTKPVTMTATDALFKTTI
jgi:hypothetical protein